MRVVFFLVALVLPQLGLAQIYKSTDEHGNVTFSDTPPQSGPSEQVQLRQTNSAPPPEMTEPRSDTPKSAEDVAEVSYSVAVVSPADETTIPMGPGNFSVSASVEPALEDGALLQLYVDGAPAGEPQSNREWQLTNVFRGAHDVTVAVIDPDGKKMAESDPVRVYVLRPSVNFRKK